MTVERERAGIIAARIIDLSETPPPIDWTIPGIAARGYLTVLAGQAGVGKSTLALQLAEQAGGPETPALYLDSENGPEHLQRLARQLRLDSERVQTVDMRGLALSDAQTVDALGRELLGIGIASLARTRPWGRLSWSLTACAASLLASRRTPRTTWPPTSLGCPSWRAGPGRQLS